ncbi:MAG: restriction endonuclease subunit S, partial [Bacteroidales bacterium]|nr:restriction endonuclease subunit S [Bacteroidales bacterium]
NYLFSALYGSKLNLPFVQQTTGIQNLNVTHYLYTKVAFPPLPEQKAIANYLDKACQRIDNIVVIKQKQVEKIEGYFFSKIKDATSIGIKKEKIIETEMPYIPKVAQNWTIDRIKDVVDFNPVKSKANVGHDEIVSVYPMEFISDVGKVLNCKQKEYHELESGLNYFQNGDVIFAKITPCMENGKGAFMQNIPTRVAYGSSEFFVLRPLFRVLGKYLYYVTRSKLFRKYLKANMKGAAGQQRVPSKFFQYCEIVFPESIKEQKEIINYLDNLSIKTKLLENKLNSQITTLQSYRKSLIHECVTGKKQVWEGEIV